VYNQALAAAGARCWNSILQGARGADTTTPFSFQALLPAEPERGWTWIMPVSALIARAFVEHNRCVMRATIHEHTLRKKATTRLESQTRAPSTFDRAQGATRKMNVAVKHAFKTPLATYGLCF
jgi:hypothetical protein